MVLSNCKYNCYNFGEIYKFRYKFNFILCNLYKSGCKIPENTRFDLTMHTVENFSHGKIVCINERVYIDI